MKKEQNNLFDSKENPLVIESLDAQKIEWNSGYFVELMDDGRVNFDTPIQRGYVWNNKKDSLLIRSILRRVPISNFYFNKVNGIYEGLEGKQRGTAIYEFIKGRYSLHSKTPPIKVNGDIYEIAKRRFVDLPKTLQNRILTYSLDGHWFEDMSIDEKIEFFILTNSGKPVTAAEISRIRIKSRDVLLSLAHHPSLSSIINEANKRKCKDEDIVAQLWCLCFGNTESLLQKDIGVLLEENEITESQKNEISLSLDYLSEYYKVVGKEKITFSKVKKPTHILSAAIMAHMARNKNINIEEYIKKATLFFNGEGRKVTNNDNYNYSVGAGSSKASQVHIRLTELEKALS